VPATASQNFISAARHPCTRPRRNDPEKASVRRFGIMRSALGATSSVPALHPPRRAFHAPHLRA